MSDNQLKKSRRALEKAFAASERTERTIRSKSLDWGDINAIFILYLIVIAAAPVRTAYFGLVNNWQRVRQSRAAEVFGLDAPVSEAQKKATGADVDLEAGNAMKVGELIEGHPVTSPRGSRNLFGKNSFHEGVDIGLAVGTKLYAPASVLVTCFEDPGGGGTVAQFDLDKLEHQLLHLSTCNTGNFESGQVIALSGNTGTSTGPHLDYRMRALEGRKVRKEPSRALLTAVLSGDGLKGSELAADNDFTNRYKAAISNMESAHDYSALNPHSGALGKYQFMPETAIAMAEKCSLDWNGPAAFLKDHPLQEATMSCYVENSGISDSNETKQCRKMAAHHYSGDASLYDNGRRQEYGGKEYPSIREYTKDVCKDF